MNICCIEETHLQEDKPFKIRGYQVFRSDRKERKKGGVMTLVRNNINALETKQFMDEAEYLEIKASIGKKYNIVNFYCPNDKILSPDAMHANTRQLIPHTRRLQQAITKLGIQHNGQKRRDHRGLAG